MKKRTAILSLLLLLIIRCANNNTVIQHEISSNIHLTRDFNTKTGKIVDQNDRFIIMKSGKVKALLDLSEYFTNNSDDDELLFHLVWIDSKGKSIYKKKEVLSKINPKLISSISISPELREPGIFHLNIYLYRTLIVSKEFELLPTIISKKEIISLATRANRKTTAVTNNMIPLMDEKWLKATVKLQHKPVLTNQELIYQFNWLNQENNIIYKKELIVASDSVNTIECSLKITPKKREEGKYKVQALLFGELIAEENFELTKPLNTNKIKAKATLYKKSKRSIKSTQFTLGNHKVYAVFDIENTSIFKDQELNYKVVWLNDKKETIYIKRFNKVSKKGQQTIKSAISITPKKRKAGNYKAQLYLFNTLITEKQFSIHKPKILKKMKTDIVFYSKLDKNTQNKIGIGTVFTLNKKAKVRAFVKVKEPKLYGKTTKLKFTIAWIGVNNKTFYSKKLELSPEEAAKGLKSAISIHPKKRKVGKYKLQIYLFDRLINKKQFTLIKP